MENTVGQVQNVQTTQSFQTPQNVQVPNYSGVNIQIFNPSVMTPGSSAPQSTINAPNYSTTPCYPQNYYTQNLAQPAQAPQTKAEVKEVKDEEPVKKKTEKREIVQLTDDYIKNLEMYLNDKNKDVRLMGAKEVLARLQEDNSRKNDAALNALINKMLQDPYQPVKFIAMSVLEAGNASGNDTSVKLLQGIQKQDTAHGQDSLKASTILLKMSGPTVKKEFEVEDKPKKESKKA